MHKGEVTRSLSYHPGKILSISQRPYLRTRVREGRGLHCGDSGDQARTCPPIRYSSGVPVSTISRISRSNSPGKNSLSSPDSPAPGSLRWRSTPSTPKVSDDTWSRYPLTPVSFSGRWTSLMSTSSTVSPRRSRSTRRLRLGTRDQRSARSPRFTITCDSFMPASAFRIAPTTGLLSPGRPRNR